MWISMWACPIPSMGEIVLKPDNHGGGPNVIPLKTMDANETTKKHGHRTGSGGSAPRSGKHFKPDKKKSVRILTAWWR